MEEIEFEKLRAEISRMQAEQIKFNNEAFKLNNEALKIGKELKWYEIMMIVSITLAIVAVVKIFL